MKEATQLCLQANPSADGSALVVFDAAKMGLEHLGGEVWVEHWAGPADRFGLFSLEVASPTDQDPVGVVEQAYLSMYAQAKNAGFVQALRIWQFIPAINLGHGDDERYKRFCFGRANALAQLGLAEHGMCAATAIGCHDATFRLFGLFGLSEGHSIENPRQVSAWQYPRDYGPVAPAFARATAVNLNGHDASQGIGLMISGTAAVIGHASAHPGDVVAQTQEAMTNIERIVQEAKTHCSETLPQLGNSTYVRVYLRHAEDWPAVSQAIDQRWPKVKVMGLRGDICREELLVELEAWHPSQGAGV